jgi:hypothetical protein
MEFYKMTPNKKTLQAMKDADNNIGEVISFDDLKKEMKNL